MRLLPFFHFSLCWVCHLLEAVRGLLITDNIYQGTGIGASIALAFATAGSKKFALLGRRVGTLQAASKNITQSFPDVHILAISTDVTDKAQVDAAFDTITNELGPVDTLVSNAGYMGSPGPLVDGNVVEAWKEFEVHVKGSINVAQAFARTASKQGAVAIHTSTLSTILPGIPNVSTYTASKLAANKIWDSFGAENPGIRVVSFHPGIIETAMSQKNGFKAHDDGKLQN